MKIGRGHLTITTHPNKTSFRRNSECLADNISTNSNLDISEIKLDKESWESPFAKLKTNQFSHRQKKFKNNNKREAIGFINDEYTFVIPNYNLATQQEEDYLGFEKLNIFGLFPSKKQHISQKNKRISLEIIGKIVNREIEKYQENPYMHKIVAKILGKD